MTEKQKQQPENGPEILYSCTSCLREADVDPENHIDSGIYIECDCGELMEPIFSNDKKTKDSK